MGKTTKSPKAVLQRSYEIGNRVLPLRWHKFSPKTFSPSQLFACLILKAFFQLDYRGTEQLLLDCPDLLTTIDLSKAPDYSTLCKAEKRLLDDATTQKLLQETIREALTVGKMKRLVDLAAVDGSGFESRHISEHFKKRQNWTGKTIDQKKYPKASIVVDTTSHMILGLTTGRGPKPDITDFDTVLQQAAKNVKIKCLLADKGYDSEKAHTLAREVLGIETLIPPRIAWKTKALPATFYRRLMATDFDPKRYGQRWQVETVFSMLKRLLSSALTARNFQSQSREISLRAITLNVMILRRFFR